MKRNLKKQKYLNLNEEEPQTTEIPKSEDEPQTTEMPKYEGDTNLDSPNQ